MSKEKIYPKEIKHWREMVKSLILFCEKENISLDGNFTLYSGNADDFQIDFSSIDASGAVFSGVDAIMSIKEFEDE